jgi:hypothetical protein
VRCAACVRTRAHGSPGRPTEVRPEAWPDPTVRGLIPRSMPDPTGHARSDGACLIRRCTRVRFPRAVSR